MPVMLRAMCQKHTVACMDAGDWMCNSCGQHNFRSRAECFKCSAPKCALHSMLLGFAKAVQHEHGVPCKTHNMGLPVSNACCRVAVLADLGKSLAPLLHFITWVAKGHAYGHSDSPCTYFMQPGDSAFTCRSQGIVTLPVMISYQPKL